MNCKTIVHLEGEADKLVPKLAWRATTPAEHQAWRKEFKAKLTELLGTTPEPVPLEVEWAETMETELFTRRKIYVRSEENYWVPAFYFVPRNRAPGMPAVVCLHGHSGVFPYIREGNDAERKKAEELELDYAVRLAEQGCITIAPMQRAWNDTEGGCHQVTMNTFLMGMTPVGLRTWDAMRLVDFLLTQEAVAPEMIATAGLSGGGTTALYFAALDERVRLAMVAGYFCTYRGSIFSMHHCICNCIPHILEWGEMSDAAALIAPRPLLVISGINDSIFPIESTRKAYGQLEKTYALLDAGENLDSDFFDGPHAWSNRKVLPFLKKHFAPFAEQAQRGESI